MISSRHGGLGGGRKRMEVDDLLAFGVCFYYIYALFRRYMLLA